MGWFDAPGPEWRLEGRECLATVDHVLPIHLLQDRDFYNIKLEVPEPNFTADWFRQQSGLF